MKLATSVVVLLIVALGGVPAAAGDDPEEQTDVELDDLLIDARIYGALAGHIRLAGPRRGSALMGHWAEDFLRRQDKMEFDSLVRRTSEAARRLLDDGRADCCLTFEKLATPTEDEKSEKQPDDVRRLLVAFDLYQFVVHRANAVPAIPREKMPRLMQTWTPHLAPGYTGDLGILDRDRLPWSAIWENGSGRKVRFVSGQVPPFAGDAEIIAEAAGDFHVLGMVRRQPLPDTVRAVPIRRGDELVEPTVENALTGKYQLGYRVYLVYRDDADRAVREFAEYARSSEGRAQIEAAGLLPVPD